jgi:hypothetical protein
MGFATAAVVVVVVVAVVVDVVLLQDDTIAADTIDATNKRLKPNQTSFRFIYSRSFFIFNFWKYSICFT